MQGNRLHLTVMSVIQNWRCVLSSIVDCTILEICQRRAGMGHISAFASANSKSQGCKLRASFSSIDLAQPQNPSYSASCIDSGESKAFYLVMGSLL